VAANNFGCGSSREQAPQVILACDVSCIIADSYARIFYRNGFNIGLPLVECKGISKAAKQGDELEVNFEKNLVINHTTGKKLPMKPIPEFMQQLLEAGGLMPYLKKQHAAAAKATAKAAPKATSKAAPKVASKVTSKKIASKKKK
jgi:3-isopropylmalate/(R)-2-methylmalate dehydratase small subunit